MGPAGAIGNCFTCYIIILRKYLLDQDVDSKGGKRDKILVTNIGTASKSSQPAHRYDLDFFYETTFIKMARVNQH